MGTQSLEIRDSNIAYPATKVTFTDPNGTSLLTSPDHAALHTSINDTVEALQDTLGTTAGTNMTKNFAAGDFPARINASNVLQQRLSGTIDNVIGGTPSLSAGTWSNAQLIGTAQITGGTATTQLFTGGTLSSPTMQGTYSGWVEDTNTWTRIGSWSFAITPDMTSVVQKGTRIRYKDTAGTYEYGVVVSSSFGGGSTTVILGTTTDSNIASGTIGNGAYSNQYSPSGYPHWFNYTRAYTGFSAAPTGGVARFRIDGRTCSANISESANGTSDATSKSVSLPVSSGANNVISIVTTVIDGGTQQFGKHLVGENAGVITSFPSAAGANWNSTLACRLFVDGAVITYSI